MKNQFIKIRLIIVLCAIVLFIIIRYFTPQIQRLDKNGNKQIPVLMIFNLITIICYYYTYEIMQINNLLKMYEINVKESILYINEPNFSFIKSLAMLYFTIYILKFLNEDPIHIKRRRVVIGLIINSALFILVYWIIYQCIYINRNKD